MSTPTESCRPDRPVLEVHGVTKHFGPVTAVRDVSLHVNRGEVCGLIGDNGAGKSTLVNLMSGTLSPDDGRLVVDGQERVFASPHDARSAGIETVFQHLALIPTLSIADNVFLGREIRRGGVLEKLRLMDKRAMLRETRDGFGRLGVTLPPLRSKVAALSGGQRQAVAIGRAVLFGSHVVIMDEPAAALGVKQTELVLQLIERLKHSGVAVIFISHNMEQVVRVCDRVTVMRLGTKVADVDIERCDATELVSLMTGARVGSAETADGAR